MANDVLDINSVQIIRDLAAEIQFKLISLYRNEHIFMASEDSNDIFHYIKDGSAYILLFKHDYEEYKTSDNDEVKIKKMISIDIANTMIMLLDNGNLKIFALPDLIYVKDFDKTDVEDFEYIAENTLIIKQKGVIKPYEVINNKLVEQKWFTIADINQIDAVTKIDKNKHELLLVHNNTTIKLLEMTLGKKKKYDLKDIAIDNNGVNFQLHKQNSSLFHIVSANTEEASKLYFIRHGTTEVTKALDFEEQIKNITVIDYTTFVEFENTKKLVNLFTLEVSEDLSTSNMNITSIDNNFSLNWKDFEQLEEGNKYLNTFEDKYKKVDIYENISHNQIAVDVQREHEKLLIVNNFSIKSKQLILNKSMNLVIPRRISSVLTNFNFESIKLCDLVYEQLNKSPTDELILLERQYVCYYKLFLLIFHNEFINSDSIQLWVKMASINKIDIKVLFYLLGFEVYGDIWIHKGLIKIVNKLKLLKLENKIQDKQQMLKSLLILLLDSELNTKINDIYHIKKSITFEFVKLLTNTEDFDTVLDSMNYVDYETFADELITTYENVQSDYILYALYKYKNDYLSCLSILKKHKQYKILQETFIENYNKIEDSVVLVDYFVEICNNLEDINEVLIKNAKVLIAKDNKCIKILLKNLQNELVKHDLLDTIKDIDSLDDDIVDIIIDYYVAKVEDYFIKDLAVHDKYLSSLSKYKQDYNIDSKRSLKEHLNDLLKKDTIGSELKQELLSKVQNNLSLIKSKFYNKFHSDLYVSLIFDVEVDIDYYIKMNDFKTLDQEIRKDNKLLIRVLSNFNQNELIFIKVLNKFYVDTISLSELVDVIPNNVKIKMISGILIKAVSQKENKSDSLTLRLKLLGNLA